MGPSIALQPYVSFGSLVLKTSGHVIRNISTDDILLKSHLEVSYGSLLLKSRVEDLHYVRSDYLVLKSPVEVSCGSLLLKTYSSPTEPLP